MLYQILLELFETAMHKALKGCGTGLTITALLTTLLHPRPILARLLDLQLLVAPWLPLIKDRNTRPSNQLDLSPVPRSCDTLLLCASWLTNTAIPNRAITFKESPFYCNLEPITAPQDLTGRLHHLPFLAQN